MGTMQPMRGGGGLLRGPLIGGRVSSIDTEGIKVRHDNRITGICNQLALSNYA